jgi:flagellar hook-associated protein 3 FlgL
MNNGIDPRSARFLVDLGRIQDRQDRAQRAVSSGIRVGRPSDDPARVMDILQLRSQTVRASTISANLDRVTSEVNTAEAAIRVAVQLVERARVLAISTASTNAENRKGIAVEARELHSQLVALTQTTSEGRYVFSGDRDTDQLYSVDVNLSAGVQRNGDPANNTRLIEDVHGAKFSVSKSAHEIFDAREGEIPTEANVFDALHSLALALEGDNAELVQSSMTKINASLEHLGRITTFYGHVQNRVSDAVTLAKSTIISRQRELSTAQDTDIAEAIVEMTLAETHQQAALGARAQLPRRTLFDYLG